MGLTVGVDIVEIGRVRQALQRHGARFLSRVYTPAEVAFCRGRVHELAARFAAKEAVMKALGTGIRGVGWRDIEVLPDGRGKPLVYLWGRALDRAHALGLAQPQVSMSHSGGLAVAFVVATAEGAGEDIWDARDRLLRRLHQRGLLPEEPR